MGFVINDKIKKDIYNTFEVGPIYFIIGSNIIGLVYPLHYQIGGPSICCGMWV